ncbi:hypothetical protein QQX98_009037 [Neonectria punicea]|uniref:NmrA-like domain-containing protein n=1 Tax=Neonectria punicea TaxID=979145 RepID=A0ABR1GTH6_9HYPO
MAADAAVAAKIKRFIPSEWGMNTKILGDTIFGRLLSDKTETQAHLTRLSKDNDFFSWTVEIADSGDERFQTTNLGFIAKVIIRILQSPDQAADRYITIASFNISQMEILALAEEISGDRWSLKPYKVDEALETAKQALEAGDSDAAFYPLLHGRLLRDGADLALKPGENFAVDVLGFSEESPKDAVTAWLGK